jgi:gamma-glutamyl:cysteine ligase YbdK (ATP-grasp superfamily)
MGLEIDRDRFEDADYARFAERLKDCLTALEQVLARPGFGSGPETVGAELEVSLIDERGRPVPYNRRVLADAHHPRLTLEADRFDLECTTEPVPLEGIPFTRLGQDLSDTLAAASRAAPRHGARVAVFGILPTLRAEDLQAQALTESPRYRALSAGLRRLRGGAPFQMHIEGEESLDVACDDVTFEGATTSWQVHLKVSPADFVDTYNAAQIAIAPVLAIAANSPLFLGRRLWDETRIALFRQAVDERAGVASDDWRPSRVTFGHGWVRKGALELFAESVALHPPVIPIVHDEHPLEAVRTGTPSLRELRLHQGTVWRWNRPVYDTGGGGHVRIEMRALPSGPTRVDMLANAAFLVGAVLALAPEADRLLTALTFGHARQNFYSAARFGIDAELLWPTSDVPSPHPVNVLDIVAELLPRARKALVAHGVAPQEADLHLGVIERRLGACISGARWQARVLRVYERGSNRDQATHAMLERYVELSASEMPVHEWPLPS